MILNPKKIMVQLNKLNILNKIYRAQDIKILIKKINNKVNILEKRNKKFL